MDFPTRTVHLPNLGGGLDFEVLADDAIIGPAIERGAWAEDEVALMSAHIRPGSRVVDLGANVGWFSVAAVLAGAEVHAFEPVPAIAAVARRNLKRAMSAPGAGRAVLHEVAAGAAAGTAQIVLGGTNHGDNRVLDDAGDAPSDMSGGQSISITIARADDLLAGPVDFLKVDTQGSEWHALQGCRKLIEDSPALGLLLEFWPWALRGTTPASLLDVLIQKGFTLGKATSAPYPMGKDRILRQMQGRDGPKGGIDLYGVKGRPFHVLGLGARIKGLVRSIKEP